MNKILSQIRENHKKDLLHFSRKEEEVYLLDFNNISVINLKIFFKKRTILTSIY